MAIESYLSPSNFVSSRPSWALFNISATVLDLINEFLSYPAIFVNTADLAKAFQGAYGVSPNLSLLGSLDIPIIIYPEKYTPIYESSVSKQMIVNVNGGKSVITDNIAVMPNVWEISGYISASPFISSSLLSVIPNGGILGAGILSSPSLSIQRQLIVNAFSSRMPVKFRPMDNEVKQFTPGGNPMVGITKMDFPHRPDCNNALPITITLQEIQELTVIGGNTGLSDPAKPISGGPSGPPAGAGNVSSGASSAPIPGTK